MRGHAAQLRLERQGVDAHVVGRVESTAALVEAEERLDAGHHVVVPFGDLVAVQVGKELILREPERGEGRRVPLLGQAVAVCAGVG